MRKLVISSLVWLSAFSPAQQISFDVLQEVSTEHSKGRNRESSQSLWMVNSQSGNFVKLQRNGYKYLASIHDPATGLLHYFNVYSKENSLVPVYANSYRYESSARTHAEAKNNVLKTAVVSETAPLEYEIKVFRKERDRKPEYIFRIKLDKALYTNLATSVDNPKVTTAVEQSLIDKLAGLPCCYRIISYVGTRVKGDFSTKSRIVKETPVSIFFIIPQVPKIDNL